MEHWVLWAWVLNWPSNLQKARCQQSIGSPDQWGQHFCHRQPPWVTTAQQKCHAAAGNGTTNCLSSITHTSQVSQQTYTRTEFYTYLHSVRWAKSLNTLHSSGSSSRALTEDLGCHPWRRQARFVCFVLSLFGFMVENMNPRYCVWHLCVLTARQNVVLLTTM